jgi:hypothetical protein
MRLSLMTLRRWIIAVAIIGALLAAFEAGRRWERSGTVAPRYVSYRVSKAIYKTAPIEPATPEP